MMQTDNFKPFKGVEMTKSVERRGPSPLFQAVGCETAPVEVAGGGRGYLHHDDRQGGDRRLQLLPCELQ